MKLLPFDTTPDFVNELGVKWWRDQPTTDYAQREDAHGTALDAVAFFVETPEGHRTRVLVSATGGVLADGQAMDAIGTKIDVLKFLERDRLTP